MPISEILKMPYDHYQMYKKYAFKYPLDEKATLTYMFARLFNLLHADPNKPYKVEDYINFLKNDEE